MLKKWFTIIELLVVVIIIWMLMRSFWGLFTNNNKDKLYYYTCSEKLYWEFNKFITDALTQKSVYSWWINDFISPSHYIINADENQQKVVFYYSWAWVKKTFYLTGSGEDGNNYCWTKIYFTKLDISNSNSLWIKFNPWLIDWYSKTDAWFGIYTWTDFNSLWAFTWEIILSYCTKLQCIQRNKIIFDRRSMNINFIDCLKRHENWSNLDCSQWTE